jgi:large conductance mechanosensitive channel
VLQEFKEFIDRGNVVDLAVAVVLGAAFTPVVGAVVDRIIMPLIGLLFGTPNFDTLGTFACDAAGDPATLIDGCAGSVGAVLTALVQFVLVGFALFLIVKAYNRLQRQQEEEVEEEPEPEEDAQEVVLLREIRDSLRGTGAPPAG